jgi:heme-degrading monooxygenase HmoA
MYVIANRIPVAEGWQEAFEERFRNRAGQIDKMKGFVRMEVMRPDGPDMPYIVQTVWESKADFEAWVGSDDFRASHANPMPKEAYAGSGSLERHEVVVWAG